MTREEAMSAYAEKIILLNELRVKAKMLQDAIYNVGEEAMAIMVDNGIYTPISELENSDDCTIESLTIFYKNNGSDEIFHDWLFGDILQIRGGRLYFSDYDSGIIEWSNITKSYMWSEWGSVRQITILGYTELRGVQK